MEDFGSVPLQRLLVPEALLKRRLEFLRAEYDRAHAPATPREEADS